MEFRYVTKAAPEVVVKMLEEIGYTLVKKSNTPHEKGGEPHKKLTLTRGEYVNGCRGLYSWVRVYTATVYTMRGDPMEPEEYFTVIRTDDPKVEREVMGKKIGNYIKCDDYWAYDDKIDKLIRKWCDV
jgi:hypothetical protein